MSENTNLPILRQENVQMIAQSAPKTYEDNSVSSLKCTQAGKQLLDDVRQHGMTDELDQRCAAYIEKTKRTIKAMNERRSPITKLFDQIRSEFTGMENSIDPTKKDTVPFLIQQERNKYAAKKHEEAERKRREEMMRQQREQAINRYKQEVEDDFRRQFDQKVIGDINTITSLNQSLTLDNFDEVSKKITNFSFMIGADWFNQLQSFVHKPYELNDNEAQQIRQETINRIAPQLSEQYSNEIGEYRDTIADALPSKKRELQRMAQADAEEQARMKAELAAKEAAEARRLDEERKRKEEEMRAAQQVQAQASEMDGLFGQAMIASPTGYQPKTSVKLRLNPLNANGVIDIISMWWSKEGQFLPVDDLCKMFKKQITYCEKVANDKDKPELISSANVRYSEEVKAK